MDFNECRRVYALTVKGECIVTVMRYKAIDFDKNNMHYHEGTCAIGPLTLACMVKKSSEQEPITFDSFCLIKDFFHPNVIRVENYYEESCQGRLILSWFKGSFYAWLKTRGHNAFQLRGNGVIFSPFFREIVIDLCSVLKALFAMSLCPINLGMDDLYIKYNNGRPKIQVLLHRVKKVPLEEMKTEKEHVWEDVKKIIRQSHQECVHQLPPWSIQKQLHPYTERFINFIGKDSLGKLERYPDTWIDLDKERYLTFLVSAERFVIGPKLKGMSPPLVWPKDGDDLKPEIKRMLAYEKTRNRSYDTRSALHYLRLCRNWLKHLGIYP